MQASTAFISAPQGATVSMGAHAAWQSAAFLPHLSASVCWHSAAHAPGGAAGALGAAAFAAPFEGCALRTTTGSCALDAGSGAAECELHAATSRQSVRAARVFICR